MVSPGSIKINIITYFYSIISEPFNYLSAPPVPLHHRSSVPNIKFTHPTCVNANREAGDDIVRGAQALDTSELERELESLCMSVTNKVMDKDL